MALYKYDGILFGYAHTYQPLNIPETAQLLRRAQSLSGGIFGEVRIHALEHPSHLQEQAFAVLPLGSEFGESELEGLFVELFGRPNVQASHWHTNPDDPEVLLMLLVRQRLLAG